MVLGSSPPFRYSSQFCLTAKNIILRLSAVCKIVLDKQSMAHSVCLACSNSFLVKRTV